MGRRLKNPLGVQEILQSPALPQDDRNASKLDVLFLRGPSVLIEPFGQDVPHHVGWGLIADRPAGGDPRTDGRTAEPDRGHIDQVVTYLIESLIG